MKPAIALFARAPIPGRVKTRLAGALTSRQACDLHRAFVLDMWAMLAAFQPHTELLLYTDEEHPEWRGLGGPNTRIQRGADLGERMLLCFQEMQSAGFGPLLILGSDSPTLTASLIAPWTGLLARSPALIGPAEDGGYYAIGCWSPHPHMFEGVQWSSAQTLSQTLAALERCGLSPSLLPSHYDVDTPKSLQRLAAEPDLPPHTRQWFRDNY